MKLLRFCGKHALTTALLLLVLYVSCELARAFAIEATALN